MMFRTAVLLAGAPPLPGALRALPQDCGSVTARAPALTRSTQVLNRTGIFGTLRGVPVGARPADAPIVQAGIPCRNGAIPGINHALVR